MQLEPLLVSLGLTEHMAALSNWRDGLIIELAADKQALVVAHETAIADLEASHATAVGALNARISAFEALQTDMTAKVIAARDSGAPEKFLEVAAEFLLSEDDKRRADALARRDAAQAELDALN